MSKYVSHDGNIVYAQPIQSFSHSGATGGALVVLADGSTRLRPTLHGYAPKVGDMFVEAVALTVLSDSRAYAEPPETAIINPTLFARLYVLAPEFAEKPGETTFVEGIEYTNAGAAPDGIVEPQPFCARCGKPRSKACGDDFLPVNAGAAPEGILSSELPHDVVTAAEIEPQPDAIIEGSGDDTAVLPCEWEPSTPMNAGDVVAPYGEVKEAATVPDSIEDLEAALDAAVDAEPENPEDNFEPPTVGNEVV